MKAAPLDPKIAAAIRGESIEEDEAKKKGKADNKNLAAAESSCKKAKKTTERKQKRKVVTENKNVSPKNINKEEIKKMDTEKRVGSFVVKSGKLLAIDPCYSDITDGITLNKVRNGVWNATVSFINKNDGWGTRVMTLRVQHESYYDIKYISELWRDGVIGVDSGQAGFFDLNSYPTEDNEEREEFYDINCTATLSRDFAGTVNNMGAVSSSGYGDGVYSLYCEADSNGETVAAEIIFVDPDEEEEEEDNSYEEKK